MSAIVFFSIAMSVAGWALLAIPISIALLIFYRLYFHPLANVPGHKLAAVSALYDFYHDCILGGKYYCNIAEAHGRYGESIHEVQMTWTPD